MKYFQILDSFEVRNRWYLGTPHNERNIEIDPRCFTQSRAFEQTSTLIIPITRGAEKLGFTLGSFDMPVVTPEVGEIVAAAAGTSVQRIPAAVQGCTEVYEILNILTELDCLDEARSEVTKWTPEDGTPERVGQLFGVGKLVLEERRIDRSPIFRIKGWELPIIVSSDLKRSLEAMGITGITFMSVAVTN